MFVPNKTIEVNDSSEIRALQERIGRWICQRITYFYPLLAYGKDYQLMVSEIQCNDPGCVPVETLILVLMNEEESIVTPSKFSTKILKPMCEVSLVDIEEIEFPFEFTNSQFTNLVNTLKDGISKALMQHSTTSQSDFVSTVSQILHAWSRDPTTITSMLKDEVQRREKVQLDEKRKVEEERKRKIQEANENITVVKMPGASTAKVEPAPIIMKGNPSTLLTENNGKPRHEKGSRRRGCPCCDPDNLDNKIDKMMFLDIPPN